jgi:peptidoglycan/LPS O-acetylase OafA/YrhL
VTPKTPILPGIQALRALAALMVVVHHAELSVLLGFGFSAKPLFLMGSAGVDVFFVISGFIMLVSSRRLFAAPRGPMTFVLRRLIRVVPLYWVVTSVYAAAFLLAPAAIGRSVSTDTVIASYAFWPKVGLDGTFHPLLVVGWTLNYEMFFYALFALAVARPRAQAVAFIVAALAATVALGAALGGSVAPLAFWGEPIVLEFAAGIGLGLAYERRAFIPRPVAVLAFLAGVLAFSWQIGLPIPTGWPRLVAYGLPALCLVGSVALAQPSERPSAVPSPVVFLGDASYSLYLVHLLALTATRFAAVRLGLVPTSLGEAIGFAAMSMAVAVFAACASYLLFERPVTRFLRRSMEKRPPYPSSAHPGESRDPGHA